MEDIIYADICELVSPKCPQCGKADFLCECEEEDLDDEWDSVDAEYNLNRYEDEQDTEL